VRRGTYLRGFAYSFIEAFAPQLRRPIVEQAMTGPIRAADPDDYQL
jgi:LysR family cys regulon transcriptional activator